MVMFVVVPAEEFLAKGVRIFLVTESNRKVRSIFQGLKLAFGKWMIIRDVWPALKYCDSQGEGVR